ncbi:hypothetical protein EV424DRAFT_1349828 [Suillus variegatus]|nr:hypothetical protein EV424DRAFT_1349828 [Suillus variegatus]
MPSLSTVKASSIKVFFKDFDLGEVFAVRSKRNRRTQCSSTTHHEGHDADIPTQTFLPVIQAIASAIPIAGPPMQAAIGGLLSILQIIDRRNQNQADLNRLRERLQRLSSHLCNAPTAGYRVIFMHNHG